jgi:UDP-N-acetyl-D-galactosamine dehydrogenase
VLGLTFKENVPDLRNSQSFDLIQRLQELGHSVDVADPLASSEEVEREHGLGVVPLDGRRYDLVVGAVAHDEYRKFGAEQLAGLLTPNGTLADLKGMWRSHDLDPNIDWWTL